MPVSAISGLLTSGSATFILNNFVGSFNLALVDMNGIITGLGQTYTATTAATGAVFTTIAQNTAATSTAPMLDIILYVTAWTSGSVSLSGVYADLSIA